MSDKLKNLLADALFHSIWCETALRRWQLDLLAVNGDGTLCEKGLTHAYSLQKIIKECQKRTAPDKDNKP